MLFEHDPVESLNSLQREMEAKYPESDRTIEI